MSIDRQRIIQATFVSEGEADRILNDLQGQVESQRIEIEILIAKLDEYSAALNQTDLELSLANQELDQTHLDLEYTRSQFHKVLNKLNQSQLLITRYQTYFSQMNIPVPPQLTQTQPISRAMSNPYERTTHPFFNSNRARPTTVVPPLNLPLSQHFNQRSHTDYAAYSNPPPPQPIQRSTSASSLTMPPFESLLNTDPFVASPSTRTTPIVIDDDTPPAANDNHRLR